MGEIPIDVTVNYFYLHLADIVSVGFKALS